MLQYNGLVTMREGFILRQLRDKHTKIACYIGYIDQAIVNNLPPLLFVTFQQQFGVSLQLLGLTVFFNFFIQIFVDLFGARFVDRIGYRPLLVAAHLCTVVGLCAMGILPGLMGNFAYGGVLLAMLLNAVGGGLLEVLVSPIMEAIPGDAKAANMSLLHSFYCWGHVSVVLLSTLYFTLFGTKHWQWLPLLWALLPLCNLFLCFRVPLYQLVPEEQRVPIKKILGQGIFWLFLLMMLASGASEQSMSQWASLFAESGLHVSKTMGDLLGPCAFAVFMGLARVYFGSRGGKIRLRSSLLVSALLCVTAYLLCVFAPMPWLSLLGCALCGLSVGLMWPGVFSMTSAYFPAGGTAMFALLALAGDVGCSLGPALVGLVSGNVQNGDTSFLTKLLISPQNTIGIGLRAGLLVAIVFPLILVICLLLLRMRKKSLALSATVGAEKDTK